MLSVFLAAQTRRCVLLLSGDSWSKLLAGTDILDSRHPGSVSSQSEASIMSQWPIRGQDIQTGRHNHKILEIGEKTENKHAPGFWRMRLLLVSYSKREIERKKYRRRNRLISSGICCEHLYQDEKCWFYCPKLSEKETGQKFPNFQIITLAGVKCETVPAPWNLGAFINSVSFPLPSHLIMSLLILFNCWILVVDLFTKCV